MIQARHNVACRGKRALDTGCHIAHQGFVDGQLPVGELFNQHRPEQPVVRRPDRDCGQGLQPGTEVANVELPPRGGRARGEQKMRAFLPHKVEQMKQCALVESAGRSVLDDEGSGREARQADSA